MKGIHLDNQAMKSCPLTLGASLHMLQHTQTDAHRGSYIPVAESCCWAQSCQLFSDTYDQYISENTYGSHGSFYSEPPPAN